MAAQPEKKSNASAFTLGSLFSIVSGGLFLLSYREGRKIQTIAKAKSPKTPEELKKLIEESPTGTVYAKFNGEATSDVPVLIQLGSQDNVPVVYEENAVFDKVIFRGNVASNGSALVRKTEQRADIYLATPQKTKVFFPRWAVLDELDTVHEHETRVGSVLASAFAGFFGLRYPYMEIHRRSILRDKARMFVAGEVAVDDDKFVLVQRSSGFLSPKPTIISRERETDKVDAIQRKQRWLNGFSGASGLIGVLFLVASVASGK